MKKAKKKPSKKEKGLAKYVPIGVGITQIIANLLQLFKFIFN